MEDHNGFLWLGGELGLWRYDGYEFKDYRHVVPERIDAQMYQDRDGLIWLGTQSGLIAFDPTTESRVTYRHDPADPHSLSDHVFQFKKQAFWEDARGRL